MRGFVVPIVLLGSTFVHAETPPECTLTPITPEVIANVDGMPSYFAKVTPDGKYVCYITGGQNVVFDLNNPKTRAVIPGPYDPVPTPPFGRDHSTYITVPSGGLNFFKASEVFASMKADQAVIDYGLTPEYKDSSNGGNYQSVGILPESRNKPIYRVLMGSLYIRDYDTSETPWKNTKTFYPCSNFEAAISFP